MNNSPVNASPGQYARHLQRELIQRSIAGWKGRSRNFLVINCGSGRYLPMLWDCGFALTAVEQDSNLRSRAIAKMGGRAEFVAASPDHLPFDNREFDCVLLQLDTTNKSELSNCIDEAMRVAARGFVVSFWNTRSLAGMFGGSSFMPLKAWPFSDVSFAVARCGRGRIAKQSTLFLTPGAWRDNFLFAFMNTWFAKSSFGAYATIRCDLVKTRPLTPLSLRLRNALGRLVSPEPAV